MSTEPTSMTHLDPHAARPASGVGPDHNPLYHCILCGRHKQGEQFEHNEHGQVGEVCRDCERLHAAGTPQRRYVKDRSHITVQSKTCRTCGLERPSDEFWLDYTNKDGLNEHCGDCVRRKRKYKSAPPAPQFESFTPASAIQPALDQAIAERDALAAEVENLRASAEERRRAEASRAPRTDLLALADIQAQIRELQNAVAAQQNTAASRPDHLRRLVSRAALLVGPAAYAVFRWADGHVLADDDGNEE